MFHKALVGRMGLSQGGGFCFWTERKMIEDITAGLDAVNDRDVVGCKRLVWLGRVWRRPPS